MKPRSTQFLEIKRSYSLSLSELQAPFIHSKNDFVRSLKISCFLLTRNEVLHVMIDSQWPFEDDRIFQDLLIFHSRISYIPKSGTSACNVVVRLQTPLLLYVRHFEINFMLLIPCICMYLQNDQQKHLIKYNTIQTMEQFMVSIVPTSFGTGLPTLANLRKKAAQVQSSTAGINRSNCRLQNIKMLKPLNT